MKKIICEHYPASRLPSDLREGIDPDSAVTVTVVRELTPPDLVMSLEEIFAVRKPPFRSKEEIDDDIRRQRDEWDE